MCFLSTRVKENYTARRDTYAGVLFELPVQEVRRDLLEPRRVVLPAALHELVRRDKAGLLRNGREQARRVVQEGRRADREAQESSLQRRVSESAINR
jgi:hypothetical protein